MFSTLLAFGMPGITEWIIIAGLGLLIFGKRLPEVGRSVGQAIVEFKRGLKGVENDVEERDAPPQKAIGEQHKEQYKFDPYTGKPVGQDSHAPSPPRGSS